jgi:signal transduction histidine kinase
MTGHAHYFEGRSRLGWLIRLRWIALAGVSLAAALADVGVVPGVNVPLVAAAVVLGVASNVVLTWRSRAHGEGHTDTRHVGQALLDTGALTLVLWAAGGADCPFVGFYAFPLLLAALLGDRPALLPTGLGTLAGMTFQVAATTVPSLRVGQWNPPVEYAGALELMALGLTVGGVAYFARVFTEAVRAQDAARRDADTVLRLSLEGLDVGLEVVRDGRVAWQNNGAHALLGPRVGHTWACPAAHGPCVPEDCPWAPGARGNTRCQVPLRSGDGPERIYEMLGFPFDDGRAERFMVLYLDRTREILAQRQLLLTERLASLGRTVQGVAHELNTPLSTIRVLAKDLEAAMTPLRLEVSARADLEESTRLIIAEVERCRRITHALLGRVEKLRTATGHTPLVEVVERAVAVVCPQNRDQVRVRLTDAAEHVQVPLDPFVQVLVNLLQNGLDAAPQRALDVNAERVGEQLVVSVRDQGPGLAAGARARLFEPFFTTKPPGQGTGLGLYTSYALAQELRGQLTLDDHPDGGAIATLSVPWSVSAPTSAASASR